VLCALLAASLLGSAPALASSQRGHVFSFAFGAQGKGEGQFSHPAGMAVDSTGDLYVADRGNNRVQEFTNLNAKGEPTFVKELKVPYPVYVAVDDSTEPSDPSKGDVYVVGAKLEEKNELEPEGFSVYKFSPTGEKIGKLVRAKIKIKSGEEFEEEFGELRGIAVDPKGSLFVYQGEEVYKFNDAAVKNETVSHLRSLAGEARAGLAVDSEDNLYLGVAETPGDEVEKELTELTAEEDELAGLVTEEIFGVVAKIDGVTGNVKVPEFGAEYTSAVAVNPKEEPLNEVSELNDVYVDDVASVAGEPVTTVAAFSSGGSPIQRFSAPNLREGDGIAVNQASGAVYVADGVSDRVDVFELERRGRPQVDALSSHELAPPPNVSNATTLDAQINPSGAETHYYFEYGPASCSSSSCTRTESTVLDKGFKGFGDQSASVELKNLPTGLYHYRVFAENSFGFLYSGEQTFTIRASLSGLPDGRQWELVSPPKKNGAEPLPINENGGQIQASLNGDAITYVANGPMPAGAEVEGNRNPEYSQIFSTRGPKEWASRDITTPNNEETGFLAGSPPEYQSFSPNLALALVEPFAGAAKSGPLAEPPLSPPLSEAEEGHQDKTIYLRDDAPEELLQPEASEQKNYEEARHNGEAMKNPGYLALVTKANAPGGKEFGGANGAKGQGEGLEFNGATPDLSHVVFKSYKAEPGIYEWSSPAVPHAPGELHAIDVLPKEPEGTRVELKDAALGSGKGTDVRHAISNDGTRVFWTSNANGQAHLYVRDTATKETLQVDAVQEGVKAEGEATAAFQTASADGSKVFFTDAQRLTADSKATSKVTERSDLYVFEMTGGNGIGNPLSGKLKDLTPEGTHGEGADLQVVDGGGGVLGASEDGSYVYFVADAALAPEATRGNCEPHSVLPGLTCNLYELYYDGKKWEPAKFIAALSEEDAPDWGSTGAFPQDLAVTTSRVSPNGEHLAFMSNRSLTGYDNEDATSEAPGERLDEEVFLYDASSGRLVCASCNPSGARPKGVQDVQANAEGESLLVDGIRTWSGEGLDPWLAGSVPGWTPLASQNPEVALYQSRYLSDSGRLFFNSPDQLVPAASGAKEKVYEYEPNGVGGCGSEAGCIGLISSGTAERESAFLDASASGNDVFFLTANQLVQQDVDTSFDVYDAHVCEPASPCLPAPAGGSPPCRSEAECRSGSSSTSPAFEAPASATSTGQGNVVAKHEVQAQHEEKPPPKPETKAQKLAKALKACKAKYKAKSKKSKRVACEKAAQKKYGAKKASKARKSSTKGRGR